VRPPAWVLATGVASAIGCASSKPAPPLVAPAPTGETLGKFVWHDLVSDDVPAARRFYGEMFGWQFLDRRLQSVRRVPAAHALWTRIGVGGRTRMALDAADHRQAVAR
jgi:hypothetical protein